ncbi:NAD-dependent epimerase/dehydratase [Gemmatirosa kalamazoonensis]|uniref:NAD-dependent epimerase/dehydratase n=1 Tax=Gemmatirosa kalamazoonensis TaxID=861299 RepID=W0RJ32_9BACT|nr:GDP-mannose 4,6-dehydratase [Gemmatirosa kalamazoonensis]AHG91109.1 NAD-dependent epimerase/dehydratase [Gemmatirosa kalamazoonensis]
MRALITGAAGFVGRWLARELVERGWDVTGAALEPAAIDGVRWVTGDVRDGAHLADALDAARPDAVFHLAGVTFVPAAGDDPGATAEVNVVAAARLLGLLRERKRAGVLDPVVVVTGSAEQYGRHEEGEMPVAERAEQRPHSVYAATKVAQEAIALEAWRSAGVRVIATRSFNHSGPGQAPHFLLPALVRRARTLRGGALRMGNQRPVRDFLHVSDVVAAYISLAERGSPGEAYNVASGVGTSVGELARRVLQRCGVDAPIASDPALVRPADVPWLVGDPSKLRAATGWSPRRTLDDLLDDLIAHHDATSD